MKSKIQTFKPFQIRERLLENKILIFTPLVLEELFHLNRVQVKYFLEEYTKKGFLVRLKKGIYSFKNDLPDSEEIANALYKPSYISLDYALSFYQIIPEIVYSVTSVTTKPTREFAANGVAYSYNTIKSKAFAGYVPVQKDNNLVLMAEPEKALVDYLYFVSLGHRMLNDRLNLKKIEKEKVRTYAALFSRKKLNNILTKLNL